MLIPREAQSGARLRQGRRGASLAELRRSIADPAAISEAHRQRLQELAQRAARVQALGDEYAGVGLSDYAKAALHRCAATA